MKIQLKEINYGKEILIGKSWISSDAKVIGFFGENGVGKSTLMKALLDHPQIDSYGMTDTIELYSDISVKKNIIFFTMFFKEKEKREQKNILKKLNFIGRDSQSVKTLSTGNQQKLYLSLILSKEKSLYLLDEPFNGLDDQSINIIYSIIQEKAKSFSTVFIVTHNIELHSSILGDIYKVTHSGIKRILEDGYYYIQIDSKYIYNKLSEIGITPHKKTDYFNYILNEEDLEKLMVVIFHEKKFTSLRELRRLFLGGSNFVIS